MDVGLIELDTKNCSRITEKTVKNEATVMWQNSAKENVIVKGHVRRADSIGYAENLCTIGGQTQLKNGINIPSETLTFIFADTREWGKEKLVECKICGILPPEGLGKQTDFRDSGAAVLIPKSTKQKKQYKFAGIVHSQFVPAYFSELADPRLTVNALRSISLFTPVEAILEEWPDLKF